jgi:hypothetical protein
VSVHDTVILKIICGARRDDDAARRANDMGPSPKAVETLCPLGGGRFLCRFAAGQRQEDVAPAGE